MFKKSIRVAAPRALPEAAASTLGDPSVASPDMVVPPPPPAPARGLSSLASDLRFEGNVSGSGDLVVDGQIKGDVCVTRLTVGESGSVEGKVAADHVEVHGRVIGAITGKQIRLIATAYVDGDITSEQLAIDIGAYFQGRVLQTRRDAVVSAASAPRPAATPVVATPSAPPPVSQAAVSQVLVSQASVPQATAHQASVSPSPTSAIPASVAAMPPAPPPTLHAV